MTPRYERTQIGYPLLAFLVGIAVFVAGPLVWMTGAVVGFWVEVVILALVGLAFGSLTVRVDDATLTWYFGPGLFRNGLPLHRIEDVRLVDTPLNLRWGIRPMERGRSFHVAGRHSVEVETTDGRVVRIGSPDPERLANTHRRGPLV